MQERLKEFYAMYPDLLFEQFYGIKFPWYKRVYMRCMHKLSKLTPPMDRIKIAEDVYLLFRKSKVYIVYKNEKGVWEVE